MDFTDYENLKNEIKTGDVYFERSRGITGAIIRFVTGGKIAHCGIFVVIDDAIYACESTAFHGVRQILAENILEKIIVVRPEKLPENLIERIYSKLGSSYDYLGAFLSVFTRLKNRKYFCSEYVAYCLDLKFSELKRNIVPSDIYIALTDGK